MADSAFTRLGNTGPAGPAGATGPGSGNRYQYSTTTTNTDPGTGKLLFDNTSLSTVTRLNISETDGEGTIIASFIQSWAAGSSTVLGQFSMRKESDPTAFAVFNIMGTVTDAGTYDTMSVQCIMRSGTFSNNDIVRVAYTRVGDKGDQGVIGDNAYNWFDNGNCEVWQRGTSFAAAGSIRCMDRLLHFIGGTTTAQQDINRDATSVPTVLQSGVFSQYSHRVTVRTADTNTNASKIIILQQGIEGYDFCALAQRPFTLSFWVKSLKTGTFCVAFGNSGGDRFIVYEYQILVSNTWEYKTITCIASPAAGTWNYTNGIGLTVNWCLAAGSTYQTTPGAWQNGTYVATSNQVNNVDSTANNFYLSQIQLNVGSVAYPYKSKPYNITFAKCQRYLEHSYTIGTVPGTPITAGSQGYIQIAQTPSGYLIMTVVYRVPKRAVPSVTSYDHNGIAGNITYWNGSTNAWVGGVPVTAVSGSDLAIALQLNITNIAGLDALFLSSSEI